MIDTNYASLAQAVTHLESGDASQAREILVGMMGSTRHGDDLSGLIFASALMKRIDANSHLTSNLYLKDYELPQIELFNLMANKFPFVKEAGRLANTLLAEALKGHEEALLMDIGIGSGQQIAALLRLMEDKGQLPRKLTVIGVEPAAASLRAAELTVRNVAAAVGVELEFIPVGKCLEDLNDAEWAALRALQGPLVINEAFSLHHVATCPARGDLKDAVLRRVRSLQPAAFVLSEPHSDHHTKELSARFANCWRHFGLAFSAIDQLDISQLEKNSIKTHFFSREIEDILGNDEFCRVERHETAAMWMGRLRRAGFTVQEPSPQAAQQPSEGITSVSLRDGYLGLDFGHQTLVAVIHAA
jgi:hypothetical protein